MPFMIRKIAIFFIFLHKIYVVGTHCKRLIETLAMSTNNIYISWRNNKNCKRNIHPLSGVMWIVFLLPYCTDWDLYQGRDWLTKFYKWRLLDGSLLQTVYTSHASFPREPEQICHVLTGLTLSGSVTVYFHCHLGEYRINAIMHKYCWNCLETLQTGSSL